MRTIIIEDESKSLQYMQQLLAKHFRQVEVVGTATNASEGIEKITSLQPDLVLLDIQLPKKNGFEMLKSLGSYQFEVIFITAFDQYAIQAIRMAALDYILKPVKLEELHHAISEAFIRKGCADTQQQLKQLFLYIKSHHEQPMIMLPLMKSAEYITPDDIIRCEAKNGYTSFYLRERDMVTVSYGMHRYADQLDSFKFIRCSQSVFVNKKYVIRMNNKNSKVSELEMKDGSTVRVSSMRKEMVKKALLEK